MNQVILITGTSSGFGLLMAARLAASGLTVAATMRNLAKKEALVHEAAKRGAKLAVFQLDVTDPASVARAVKEVVESFGRIDVLVNNAGYGIGGAFEDLTDVEFRSQMETNFFGVLNVTRAVFPLMRKQGRGAVINISSVSGFSSPPCLGAYSASKWALEAISESLYYEVEPFGIKVYLVQPGSYGRTRIFQENVRYADRFGHPESPYQQVSLHLKEKVMRYAAGCRKDPETVAKMVEGIIRRSPSRFRHNPDGEARAQFLLRKILPFSVYSWIYRKLVFRGLARKLNK